MLTSSEVQMQQNVKFAAVCDVHIDKYFGFYLLQEVENHLLLWLSDAEVPPCAHVLA